MANPEHLKILRQGVKVWNEWRSSHPDQVPDLSDAKLDDLGLAAANLAGCKMIGAWLVGVRMQDADLSAADLSGAVMSSAWLWGANLSGTNLRETRLDGANLLSANLQGADLTGAHLSSAHLMHTNLRKAILVDCNVYGASVWDVDLTEAVQSNLTVTHVWEEARVSVDSLDLAQFMYLLLNNEKVRSVIDTLTSKVVLILGRFTPERKEVLDAIRIELRKLNFTPVTFDFDKPASKDVTGTVETLARMARFIIADLTDPSSIPHELATVVPYLRTTPVQPLRLASTGGYSMFDDLKSYPWVLETYQYETSEKLIGALKKKVIGPAEAKVKELK